jgi:DNA-binding NarL/FixJ family response regulator
MLKKSKMVGSVGLVLAILFNVTTFMLPAEAKLVEPLGYIHKPFSDEQIAAALKMACYQISRNGVWPNTLDELPPAYKNFTVTETRIVQLTKQGKSTNEIGNLLKRSPATVIWHRKNIRKKLGIAETKKDIRSTLLSSEM